MSFVPIRIHFQFSLWHSIKYHLAICSKHFRAVHVFSHSCLANWESLPLRTNKTSINPWLFTIVFFFPPAAQANNELRKKPLTRRDLKSIMVVWFEKYYDIALDYGIPVTCFDASTDSMHRILQHVTAHNGHSHKVHHFENVINLRSRRLKRFSVQKQVKNT